ncbi:MAG: DNA recombination protein RmuC [Calothrix sp. SM1_5_4]|nr:DNA recombination protein RmuC [Calothrix sp. SM1_5_4]
MERYQAQVGLLEKERQRAFQTIDSELKKVADSHLQLAKETGALKDALKKPHVRGRWGEVQLRNCIELAGMSEYADVSFQDFTADEEGAAISRYDREDAGGRRVIVDAKTPIDAFLNSLEAPTEEIRAAEMTRHGRHLKEHVKRLSTRGTPMPSERAPISRFCSCRTSPSCMPHWKLSPTLLNSPCRRKC